MREPVRPGLQPRLRLILRHKFHSERFYGNQSRHATAGQPDQAHLVTGRVGDIDDVERGQHARQRRRSIGMPDPARAQDPDPPLE